MVAYEDILRHLDPVWPTFAKSMRKERKAQRASVGGLFEDEKG